MYCPNCGRELPEGGTCLCVSQNPVSPGNDPGQAYGYPPVQSSAPPTYSEETPPAYAYAAPPPPLYGGYAPLPYGYDPPALCALKTVGSSSLMLCFCILLTATSLAAAVAGIFFPTNVPPMQAYFNTPQEHLASTFSSFFFLAALGALPAIGMWLFYFACRTPLGPVSTGGLTLYKVIYLIGTIFLTLACVVLGGLFCAISLLPFDHLALSVGAAGLPDGIPAFFTDTFLFVGILLFCLAAVQIVIMVFMTRTLNGLRDVARSGAPNQKTTQFVIVLLFLSAAGALISTPLMGATFFLSLLSAAGNGALALLLRQHRKNMNQIIAMGYNPPYPPQGI